MCLEGRRQVRTVDGIEREQASRADGLAEGREDGSLEALLQSAFLAVATQDDDDSGSEGRRIGHGCQSFRKANDQRQDQKGESAMEPSLGIFDPVVRLPRVRVTRFDLAAQGGVT